MGNVNNILITCSILGCLTLGILGDRVVIYDQADGKGIFDELDVRSCIYLPRGWDSKISSISLQGYSCVEIHSSALCMDPSPVTAINSGPSLSIINLENMSHILSRAIRPCSPRRRNSPLDSLDSDLVIDRAVTLYEYIDLRGFSANIKIGGCSEVPRRLSKNVASVDTHGNCVKLYSEARCRGQSVQIQPTDIWSLNLYAWDFMDRTRSIGPCADYQSVGLSIQNLLRKRHSSEPLTLNETLNLEAANVANSLINTNSFAQPNFGLGVLVFSTDLAVSSLPQLVQQAMSSWYAEGSSYNPRNPMPSAFTQLIWKSTSQMGIAVVSSSVQQRSIVVAKYTPPGNTIGQFANNVSPSTTTFGFTYRPT